MTSPPPSTSPRTRVYAVLGGIASGKSRVAALLAGPSGLVLDADRIAREVLESPEGLAHLREDFGAGVLDASGRPDRARIAERIFRDVDARSRLEGWIHPGVRARIRADLEAARREGLPRVVLDVPLLLENRPGRAPDDSAGNEAPSPSEGAPATPVSPSDLLEACDHLIFVDSEPEERDRRAVAHRGWEPGEVARREANQLSLDEKCRRSDTVLSNRGTEEDLERAVGALLDRLESDASTPRPSA